MKRLLPGLIIAVIFLLSAQPGSAQTAKLEDLRVSFASFGVIYYPHFIAKELGYYRDEGFDIEVIAMPGGLATQALVAGDLQFSTSSGSSLNASLRGIKLKVVYVNLDRPLYKLISWRDDIRGVVSAAQAHLDHRDVDCRVAKDLECRRGRDFEVRGLVIRRERGGGRPDSRERPVERARVR